MFLTESAGGADALSREPANNGPCGSGNDDRWSPGRQLGVRSGFAVWDWGSEFGIQSLGFGVWGLDFGVRASEFEILTSVFCILNSVLCPLMIVSIVPFLRLGAHDIINPLQYLRS